MKSSASESELFQSRFKADRSGVSSLRFFLMALHLLHDTTTKCHAASHPGVSSPWLLYQDKSFTLARNLATVSCKHETTTSFSVKSVCW